MVFGIKAIVYGLGGVLAAGGIGLMALGYNVNPNNLSEVATGEWLVGTAVVMWIVGLVIRESRRCGAFHRG